MEKVELSWEKVQTETDERRRETGLEITFITHPSRAIIPCFLWHKDSNWVEFKIIQERRSSRRPRDPNDTGNLDGAIVLLSPPKYYPKQKEGESGPYPTVLPHL